MGETKVIHKFKKKKRFGSSICRRAPGAFDKMLREKTLRYGGFIVLLDPRITASSQTDHTTGKRTKMDLSQRTKIIDGQLVQRDLYAAFLNDHTMPGNILDIEACKKDFPLFLKRQAAIVDIMRLDGDLTGNFGLSDFV